MRLIAGTVWDFKLLCEAEPHLEMVGWCLGFTMNLYRAPWVVGKGVNSSCSQQVRGWWLNKVGGAYSF